MALETGSIGVSVVLSIVLTTILIIIVGKKLFIPILKAVIDEKLKDVDNMMKAAASSLGSKSGEARQVKKMEKLMISDIMEEYPELEIALEYFSPETADLIKKHPQRALTLLARYKPILDDILGRDIEQKEGYQY